MSGMLEPRWSLPRVNTNPAELWDTLPRLSWTVQQRCRWVIGVTKLQQWWTVCSSAIYKLWTTLRQKTTALSYFPSQLMSFLNSWGRTIRLAEKTTIWYWYLPFRRILQTHLEGMSLLTETTNQDNSFYLRSWALTVISTIRSSFVKPKIWATIECFYSNR